MVDHDGIVRVQEEFLESKNNNNWSIDNETYSLPHPVRMQMELSFVLEKKREK